MDYSFYTLIILLSLLFSAFFSGMEIAFLSSNRLKIELDRHKGTFNGKVMGKFYKKESFFIALLLLGNNIALVLFGIYAAKILQPIVEGWGILEPTLILIIQTILSTLLVLVVSEFLPKALVQINPNGFLRIATTPMLLIYSLLYLPTQLVMFVSGLFLRLL
jgi:CBS domain containing-hemolysin-like protein